MNISVNHKPGDAADLESHKGGCTDRQGPGCHLGYGNNIRKHLFAYSADVEKRKKFIHVSRRNYGSAIFRDFGGRR